MITTSQSTVTEELTTVGVPVGTEKSTGGINEEQMIVIIVCLALIVLFIIVVAVYFLGIKRRKGEKGILSFLFRTELTAGTLKKSF